MRYSAIILLILTAAACSLQEPKLPKWETNWTVFLPLQNFLMEEVLNDSTLVGGTNAQGEPILILNISDSTDWERISDKDLSIKPDNDHFEAEIGEIRLDDPADLKSSNVTPNELLPPELLAFGDTLPPYDSLMVHPPQKELEYDHYQWAQIKSGKAWLIFYNNLFLTIRPGMEVKVYNNGGTEKQLIDVLRFNRAITSGDTVKSTVMDLGGKRISNHFVFEYTIPIAGTDTFTVLTEEMRQGIGYSELRLRDIVVSKAMAKIPAQEIIRNDSLDISEEEHKLSMAQIERGKIQLKIKNYIPVTADVVLVLPDLRYNGQPKTIERRLDSGQDYVETISLRDYTLENHLDPGATVESISYAMSANMAATDEYVLISENDSVVVDVVMDTLFFSALEGILDRVDVDIEASELESIDYFENLTGNIRLEDLVMNMRFENEIDLPIYINLKIAGYHRDEISDQISDSVRIFIDETILPSSEQPYTVVSLDKNFKSPNSIVDLVEILPTEIKITGSAYVQGEGNVEVGQGLRVLYNITSPLSIKITDPILYETSIDSIKEEDLDSDTRTQITENIQQAVAEVTLTNYLPVGASFKFFLAVDSTRLFTEQIADSANKIVLQGSVQAAAIENDGYSGTPGQNIVLIELNETQMQLFKQHPIYIRQAFTIQPSEQTVKFRQADEIEVAGKIKVKYLVDTE